MDVNIILDAANQFLLTPQGQKLLESLDIDNIDKVTEAIKLVQQSNVVNGQEIISTEVVEQPELTREERRELRKEKRKSRNELISEEYDKAKAEGKEKAGKRNR